jgi:hypothetical protein
MAALVVGLARRATLDARPGQEAATVNADQVHAALIVDVARRPTYVFSAVRDADPAMTTEQVVAAVPMFRAASALRGTVDGLALVRFGAAERPFRAPRVRVRGENATSFKPTISVTAEAGSAFAVRCARLVRIDAHPAAAEIAAAVAVGGAGFVVPDARTAFDAQVIDADPVVAAVVVKIAALTRANTPPGRSTDVVEGIADQVAAAGLASCTRPALRDAPGAVPDEEAGANGAIDGAGFARTVAGGIAAHILGSKSAAAGVRGTGGAVWGTTGLDAAGTSVAHRGRWAIPHPAERTG